MEKPKILVTICNYNHSNYLKESIASIQEQTYQNLDICVIDDFSEDREKVADIVNDLKKEDSRIRFIQNEKNIGKWYCLNESIKTTEATICTAHDADDVSLRDRIHIQQNVMNHTKTIHNLCGFYHCWKEDEVQMRKEIVLEEGYSISVIDQKNVSELVIAGFSAPQINHYFTGNFETAGVSAMFFKDLWKIGFRYNPPSLGLRTLMSEDSDFNFRVTTAFKQTSVVAEKLYLYRRNTSTNKELM